MSDNPFRNFHMRKGQYFMEETARGLVHNGYTEWMRKHAASVGADRSQYISNGTVMPFISSMFSCFSLIIQTFVEINNNEVIRAVVDGTWDVMELVV